MTILANLPHAESEVSGVGTRLVKGWHKVDTRLAQGWRKVGTRLVPGWHKVGARLAQAWHKVGTRLGTRLAQGWVPGCILRVNMTSTTA